MSTLVPTAHKCRGKVPFDACTSTAIDTMTTRAPAVVRLATRALPSGWCTDPWSESGGSNRASTPVVGARRTLSRR